MLLPVSCLSSSCRQRINAGRPSHQLSHNPLSQPQPIHLFAVMNIRRRVSKISSLVPVFLDYQDRHLRRRPARSVAFLIGHSTSALPHLPHPTSTSTPSASTIMPSPPPRSSAIAPYSPSMMGHSARRSSLILRIDRGEMLGD
jgi:hypothetical protein